MSTGGQREAWDIPVSAMRVGDLLLTQAGGSARLARLRPEAPDAAFDEAQSLPSKQARLLDFLMRHHRQIVSKSRLIEAVWGFDGATPGVLDVHMTRLRRALQRVDTSGERVRIETRRGMGYALVVDE